MISLKVEYTVKSSELGAVVAAIKTFVAAVSHEPNTLTYEAFQLPDKVSFLHVMSFKDKNAEHKHATAAHTKKFVDTLYRRCVKEPVFTPLKAVKSQSI